MTTSNNANINAMSSEDPFDAFVDLQMADESTPVTASLASSHPAVTMPGRIDTQAAAAAAVAAAATGMGLSWGSADPALSPPLSTTELLQYYLSDQLAFIGNDPTTLAEVAAAAAVSGRNSASPVHSPLRAAFDPQVTAMPGTGVAAPGATSPTGTTTSVTPGLGPVSVGDAISTVQNGETSLGFVSSLAAINAVNNADAWMSHFLSPVASPSGPAVQPSQLMLYPTTTATTTTTTTVAAGATSPDPSGMEVDDAEASSTTNHTTTRREGRRHSVSSKVATARAAAGAPYATPSTNGTTTGGMKRASRAPPIKTSLTGSRAAAAETTTVTSPTGSDTWPESPRSRRGSKHYSRNQVASSDEDDLEDEDMVNELISLRAGVAASKGLGQARRDPLPDEDEIRKMTPKERRQLRNKISARNFRLRRKEYIGTLEAEVKETRGELSGCRSRLSDVEQENRALRKEVCSLREQLEAAIATAAAATMNIKGTVPPFGLSTVGMTSNVGGPGALHEMTPGMAGSPGATTGATGSTYNLMARKRTALRGPAAVGATAMTRSASNSSTASGQLLTPTADDIHKDRSASHPTWGEHRIIVH